MRKKSIKLETLKVTVDNLIVCRHIFVDMGKPRATIHKIDDAFVALSHLIEELEDGK
jgi:hypothetical protein